MADEILKSRHAFGSINGVDDALSAGKIDAYDILFLTSGDEHKIGWIDKDGNKVILEDKKGVVTVNELPETGDTETVYICGSKFYLWNGSAFVCPSAEGGLDETVVDEKIEDAVTSANAYTDEQIAAITQAMAIVEF